MTDNVTEVEFKKPEQWTVGDIIRQVGKMDEDDIESMVVITLHGDETIAMLANSTSYLERIGLLETVKHMHISEPGGN